MVFCMCIGACAIRCITCVVKGFANAVDTDGNKPSADRLQSLICQLSLEIAKPSLYAFRDGCLMEAIVLLVRMLLIEFPSYCAGSAVQQQVCIALIFLLGRCPGESTVIEKAARWCVTTHIHTHITTYTYICSLYLLDHMFIF